MPDAALCSGTGGGHDDGAMVGIFVLGCFLGAIIGVVGCWLRSLRRASKWPFCSQTIATPMLPPGLRCSSAPTTASQPL